MLKKRNRNETSGKVVHDILDQKSCDGKQVYGCNNETH